MSASAKSRDEQTFLLTAPWGLFAPTCRTPFHEGVQTVELILSNGTSMEGKEGLHIQSGFVALSDGYGYAVCRDGVTIRARAITMI